MRSLSFIFKSAIVLLHLIKGLNIKAALCSNKLHGVTFQKTLITVSLKTANQKCKMQWPLHAVAKFGRPERNSAKEDLIVIILFLMGLEQLSHCSDQVKRWMIGVPFSAGSCSACPASYSMGTDIFPEVQLPQRESGHSPPPSAEVKNRWSYASTHSFVFLFYRIIIKAILRVVHK